jgi:hypothetical protein
MIFKCTSCVNQRRSQRILLSVSIAVSGDQAGGAPFVEPTSTVIVNVHGALIRLREPVRVGQRLRIKNVMTNEERLCVVADVNPGQIIPEVGVAFSESCPKFWRVSFPPEDGSPRGPKAKRIAQKTDADVAEVKR